ncbi:hypothetical protein RKE30_16095 [Streptomyces sp. Li-HN-5-11]|uniref:hypothetical protein n=1 Tax=Streptomyces sp. Li-HN-5-11 TaxID=3075432 RepID=UPI0028AD9CA5|nr:hypothetical protein [Streptomyces sp. Li-HN-5-11]WNM31819.1 hypothetical protein RKE30_16095 [Streptomyces sp. Li-HN-5-11]
MAVLLIACSAVVTGAKSFVAIDEWASDPPQDVLARPGARTGTALAVRVPPSGATIRRVIKDNCPGGLADLLGHDPAGTDTLAIDGKSARGSRLGTTPAAHLPAAMTGTGMTVTQLRVPEKTNENHHRPDQPPDIPGTQREDLEGALGDRKHAPLREGHRLP